MASSPKSLASKGRLWSATQVQPDLTNLIAPGPKHFERPNIINSVCRAALWRRRLPNRWNATIATSGLSTALDERPRINGIRGEEVTKVRSSIPLDAEEVCQGPSPWDSFGALVKTKVPARLHRRAHASTP